MANKKPPTYPPQFQQAADFVESAASTVGNVVSSAEAYLASPDEINPEEMDLFQKEIIQPIKGVGSWVFFDFWPGLKKSDVVSLEQSSHR